MIKFVANNNKFIFTKLFLFFALRNLYLYINFGIINFLYTTTCKQINKKKTTNISKII